MLLKRALNAENDPKLQTSCKGVLLNHHLAFYYLSVIIYTGCLEKGLCNFKGLYKSIYRICTVFLTVIMWQNRVLPGIVMVECNFHW
jgi:hypothetical protein